MSTLPGLLLSRATATPNQTALRHHTLGIWEGRTWSTLRDQVVAAGNGLHDLGVRQGHTVALLCANKPEWVIADLAIQGLGAKTLALHPDLSPETVVRLLERSEASVVIVGDEEQFDKVAESRDLDNNIKSIVVVNTRGIRHVKQATSRQDRTIPWEMLEVKGTDHWTETARSLNPDAPATIEVVVEDGKASTRERTSNHLLAAAQRLSSKLDAHGGDELLPIASFAEPLERSISEVLALQLGATLNIGEGGPLERHELAAVQPTIVHVPTSALDSIRASVESQAPRWGLRRQGILKLLNGSGDTSRNSRPDLLTVRIALVALVVASIVIHQLMYDVTGWIRLAIIIGMWLLVIGGLIMSGHAIRPFVRRAYGLANARSLLTGPGLSPSTAAFFGALHLAPITEHASDNSEGGSNSGGESSDTKGTFTW